MWRTFKIHKTKTEGTQERVEWTEEPCWTFLRGPIHFLATIEQYRPKSFVWSSPANGQRAGTLRVWGYFVSGHLVFGVPLGSRSGTSVWPTNSALDTSTTRTVSSTPRDKRLITRVWISLRPRCPQQLSRVDDFNYRSLHTRTHW